jgi:hypothetical protein
MIYRNDDNWSMLIASQGGSLASVFENIVKASHLNVTKNLTTSMGPQLLFQTLLFSRIGKISGGLQTFLTVAGVTHLALLNCEIFHECYASKSQFEDSLKCTFRSCLLVRSFPYFRDSAHVNAVSAMWPLQTSRGTYQRNPAGDPSFAQGKSTVDLYLRYSQIKKATSQVVPPLSSHSWLTFGQR